MHRFDFEDGRHTVCGLLVTTSTMKSTTLRADAVTCLECLEDWQLEDLAWTQDGTPAGQAAEAEIGRRAGR